MALVLRPENARLPRQQSGDIRGRCRRVAESLSKPELVVQLARWCTEKRTKINKRKVDDLRSFYAKEVAPRLSGAEWTATTKRKRDKEEEEEDNKAKRLKTKAVNGRLVDDKLTEFVTQHLGEVFYCRHSHQAPDLFRMVGHSKKKKKILLKKVDPVCEDDGMQGGGWTLNQASLPKPVLNEEEHDRTAFVKREETDDGRAVYSFKISGDHFFLMPPGTVLSGSWCSD